MQRYLVFFSYIGSRFRGAQAQLPPNVTPWLPGNSRLGDFEDRTTVQGMFNIALKRFKPLNTPILVLSSRTDTGVHALCSSGHVDLLHPRHESGARYTPEFLVAGLNRTFDKAKAEISVRRVLPVPDSVHSRYSAVAREYLYRLAVVQPHAWPEGGDGTTARALTPADERHRCYVIGGEFCMSRVRACAQLLSGEHDYRAFMGSQKGARAEVRTRRHLEVDVTPGASAFHTPDLQFWNISFRSRGFLFRQVRRTVGVLVSCGRGRMSLDDVRRLLDQPDKDSWSSLAATAPPHGLYLSRVEYRLSEDGQVVGTEEERTEEEEDMVADGEHTVMAEEDEKIQGDGAAARGKDTTAEGQEERPAEAPAADGDVRLGGAPVTEQPKARHTTGLSDLPGSAEGTRTTRGETGDSDSA